MRSRGKMSNRASTHKTLPKSRRHETTCCSQPQQMIISEWTPLLLSSCVKFMLSHLPALPPPHRIEHAPSVRIISFSIRAIDPTPDPSPKPCVVCACGSKSASFHWPTPQFFSLSLSLQMLSFTAPPFSLSRPSVGVVEHPIRIKPVEPKKKRENQKTLAPCRCLLLLEIGAIAKEKQQQETQDCCFVRVSPPRADPFCSAQPRDCARANL